MQKKKSSKVACNYTNIDITQSLTCSGKTHVGRKWCHTACPPECGHWCTGSHPAVSGNQEEGSSSWVTGRAGNWEPIKKSVCCIYYKSQMPNKVYLCYLTYFARCVGGQQGHQRRKFWNSRQNVGRRGRGFSRLLCLTIGSSVLWWVQSGRGF